MERLCTGRKTNRRSQRREKILVKQVCNKIKEGKDVYAIVKEVGVEEATTREICYIAQNYAPDYDIDKILDEVMQKETVLN